MEVTNFSEGIIVQVVVLAVVLAELSAHMETIKLIIRSKDGTCYIRVLCVDLHVSRCGESEVGKRSDLEAQAGGADHVRVDEVANEEKWNYDDLHVYFLAEGHLLEAFFLGEDVAAYFFVWVFVHILVGLLDVERDQKALSPVGKLLDLGV